MEDLIGEHNLNVLNDAPPKRLFRELMTSSNTNPTSTLKRDMQWPRSRLHKDIRWSWIWRALAEETRGDEIVGAFAPNSSHTKRTSSRSITPTLLAVSYTYLQILVTVRQGLQWADSKRETSTLPASRAFCAGL